MAVTIALAALLSISINKTHVSKVNQVLLHFHSECKIRTLKINHKVI